MRLCENENCNKRAIDYSVYCGEHTSNKDFINQISSVLSNSEKNFNNIYISEVEVDSILLIEGREFDGCEFNDCGVENLQLVSCVFNSCIILEIEFTSCYFESCSFIDCEFDRVNFSESIFNKCIFKDTELNNCEIVESSSIKSTNFKLCKFSNVHFFEILDGEETEFNQCVFIHSSFGECNLDNIIFKYTSFLSTGISYCSLRYSKFIGIDEDFESTGAPIACDLFGTKIDDNLKDYLSKFYNNFDSEIFSEFIEKSISKLVELNHPNYLSGLTYFIEKYESIGGNHLEYKSTIIFFYKKLYDISIDTNNAMMAGSIINEYSRLPDSIRGNLIELASPESAKDESLDAYLTINFNFQRNITFEVINESNRLLSKITSLIGFSKEYNVISVRKGSLTEIINGNISDITMLGGALYAGSSAVLSLVKKGVEIHEKKSGIQKVVAEVRKITAESKKIELENEKVERDIILNKKIPKKTKANKYIDFLKEEGICQKNELEHVKLKIKHLMENSEYIRTVDLLDSKYKIQGISIKKGKD